MLTCFGNYCLTYSIWCSQIKDYAKELLSCRLNFCFECTNRGVRIPQPEHRISASIFQLCSWAWVSSICNCPGRPAISINKQQAWCQFVACILSWLPLELLFKPLPLLNTVCPHLSFSKSLSLDPFTTPFLIPIPRNYDFKHSQAWTQSILCIYHYKILIRTFKSIFLQYTQNCSLPAS